MTDIKARIIGGGLRETPDGKYAFFEIQLEGDEPNHQYNHKRVTWSRGMASDKSIGAVFKTLDKLGAKADTLNTFEDCEKFVTSIIGRTIIAASIEEKSIKGKTYLQCSWINSIEESEEKQAVRYGAKASDDLNARFAAAKASILTGAIPGQLAFADVDSGDEEIPF